MQLVDYIQDIYQRLSELQVLLDADPLQYGPKRLNGKIQQARDALTKVDSISLDLSNKIQTAKRAVLSAETLYEVDRVQLLAHDDDVKLGRSGAEREALVSVKLKDQLSTLNLLRQELDEYQNLMVAVKAKRTDLKDVRSAIREQVTMVHDEIKHLSVKWGNQDGSTPSVTKEALPGSDKLDALLDGI